MKGLIIGLMALLPLSAGAQQLLTLDSCRAMALRDNKQLGVARLKKDVAHNLKKSARTKYLPRISALGTYQYTSESISLLSDENKDVLNNLGTNAAPTIQSAGTAAGTAMTQFGTLLAGLSLPAAAQFQTMATAMQTQMQQGAVGVVGQLNQVGQKIVDDFNTDTHNLWAGSIMLTQPIFLGGSLVAMNKIADINEQMAENSEDARRQMVVYAVDQAYWQVVSLCHKKKLAESYLQVVSKLDSDVQKMIREGVATRSDGLSVSVKVSEAEMAVQKVNDGLTLSRMLLCQIIGLPTDSQILLADEQVEKLDLADAVGQKLDIENALNNRPEMKILNNTIDIARQTTKIMRAGYMPQVALTGGYSVSNPSLFNGFEKKFRGFWNVGVLMRVPIWNWGDTHYKVRASKGATAIATLERDDVREKLELQINQSQYRVDEASKRLAMAEKSIQRADENLRTAQLGFREGVITPTVVMEAQTAWLLAKSQKIDAEIEMKLSQVDLRKALGTLNVEN